MDKGKPAYINTKSKIKVYTFLDGSINILFNDIFYKTKQVAFIPHQQNIKPSQTQADINSSKSHKPSSNHPWVIDGKNKYNSSLQHN